MPFSRTRKPSTWLTARLRLTIRNSPAKMEKNDTGASQDEAMVSGIGSCVHTQKDTPRATAPATSDAA